AEDGIRDLYVTGVQTCALPILILDAERAHPERHHVVLALEFDAAEGGVALRIERLLQFASGGARRAERPGAGIDRFIAGLTGQGPEDEPVEARVKPGKFKAERGNVPSYSGFERLGDLDLEVRIANVERGSRIMG